MCAKYLSGTVATNHPVERSVAIKKSSAKKISPYREFCCYKQVTVVKKKDKYMLKKLMDFT